MAARDNFGSQFALLAFVAFTASTASNWYEKPSHEPTPSVATQVPQQADPESHTSESAAAIVPAPVLRPLALLANAIGAEPLFILKTPGHPALNMDLGDTEPCPPRHIANSNLLTNEQDVCRVISAMRKQVAPLKVKIMIATLPDWVDSSLQWTFDPMLDAIQKSAAQMGYVLTGFDMADTDPDPATVQPKGSKWPFPLVHELTPGSLLFRRLPPDANSTTHQDPDFLLILLVGETATGGVHSAAFAAALDLALVWDMPSSDRIGILGPTYSGSTFSMLRGLEEAAVRHGISPDGDVRYDVISGSASSEKNVELFAASKLIAFESTTRSDAEELLAVARYLGQSKPGWECGRNMAILVESNTAWGRDVVGSLGPPSTASAQSDPSKEKPAKFPACDCSGAASAAGSGGGFLPCAVVVQFPLHISRLRDQSQTPGHSENAPSKSAVALDLSEKIPPVDRVPPETPQLTAATVETMVDGMFRAIQDRRVTAIGILATDKRDQLYLAEEIARSRPNVLMFTTKSSLVYLHPDVADFVRGTLVASTYSLSDRTQRLTPPFVGQRYPEQFGSSLAHGAFNALAVLMGHPNEVIDYDTPVGINGKPTAEPTDSQCGDSRDGHVVQTRAPPIWISVVGHSELLPLHAGVSGHCADPKSGTRSGYALELKPADVNNGATATATATATAVAAASAVRIPYLSAHLLFLLFVATVWLGMIGYQVWLQRRIDLWNESGKIIGTSSFDDWVKAARNLLRSLGHGPTSKHPAAAEFMASVAAVRGATLTLILWWLKLSMIYAADHLGFDLFDLKWTYVAIAGSVSLFVVWQTINAFWLIGTGTWRVFCMNRLVITLLLAITVISSLGGSDRLSVLAVDVAGAIFGGILMILDSSDSASPAISNLARWRRLPAMLALGAFVALGLDLMCRNWDPVDALLYVDRTASVRQLVSPAAPILLFSIALFWWGVWNVRRLQILRLPEGEVGIGALLADRARAAGIDSQFFRQPTLTLGSYIVLPSAAAALALGLGYRYVGTIDGRFFGEFMLLGAVAIATIMLHALAHAAHLTNSFVELLKAIARHPANPIFREIGKEPIAWRNTYRESTRPDLETLKLHVARLLAALGGLGPVESQTLGQGPSVKTSLEILCRSTLSVLNANSNGRVRDRSLALGDWQELDSLSVISHAALQNTLWSSTCDLKSLSAALTATLDEMQYIVVFHTALVLRHLTMRLVSGFTMVIGGLLLLVAAHLLYSFEGRVFWLSFDAFTIGISAASAVWLLMRMERESVLSALRGTTPGKNSLFGGLTWRMATYGAISAATLFAVVFPELGGHIWDWITPARAVLSE
jgi:hypothetical protein